MKKSLARCIGGKRAFNEKIASPINPLSCKVIKEHGLNQGSNNAVDFRQGPAVGRLGTKDEFLGSLHMKQGDNKGKKKGRNESKDSQVSQTRINANK